VFRVLIDRENRKILRCFLKVLDDVQSVTKCGRLFHARGPATAKARSPSVERRVAGTTGADENADLTRRCEVTSERSSSSSSIYSPSKNEHTNVLHK